MSKDPRRNELGERLAPGAWVDKAGALHFSAPEILAELGMPDTEENRAGIMELMREILAEKCPQAEVIMRQSPDE